MGKPEHFDLWVPYLIQVSMLPPTTDASKMSAHQYMALMQAVQHVVDTRGIRACDLGASGFKTEPHPNWSWSEYAAKTLKDLTEMYPEG